MTLVLSVKGEKAILKFYVENVQDGKTGVDRWYKTKIGKVLA